MTGLFLCLSLIATPQQAPASAPAPVAAADVRLNGVWDVNKDLSTKPAAPPNQGGRDGDQGGDRSGGGPGGGGGRGGRGGGMRGGGGGGRSGGSPEDMRKARDLMQELGQAPARLTIVSRRESVSITDPEGVIRKFVSSGKKDSVAINGSTIEVKSKWDGEVFSQEFNAGSAKFIRTIETSIDGHQMVITVTPKGDGGGIAGPSFMRFVYDRSQLQ